MVGGILCPDCGGVVGATESSEDGDPCRCFVAPPSDASHDTEHDAVPTQPAAKICRACAKDLNGHKRVRDNGGYLCYECHKAEEKRLNQGRVRCGACGHLTREENLALYEGTRICPTCREERTSLNKQRLATIGVKTVRKKYEVKQVYLLLAVLALLLAVILIGVHLHNRH